MNECKTCHGAGRIEYGEFGFDCAAMHNGGRMPDAPGLSRCDDCGGTGETSEPIEDIAVEDVMFAIFEYARISDGVESTDGPKRALQRDRMWARQIELRRMLDALQTHAYAEGRKDQREHDAKALYAFASSIRLGLA